MAKQRIETDPDPLPMVLQVVILCGGCNSGKSRTLRALRDNLLSSRDGIPQFRRRPVHLEISSLQEHCGTCDEEGRGCVVRTMGEWVECAEEEGASLLIIPFTVKYSRRSGELNEDCIRGPLKVLRRRGLRYHIVYLRKEHQSLMMNVEMDELMRELFNRIIESRRDGELRQARKLFQFIGSIA
jgi:hypothetical protein